jgi:hypothetical protein
MSLDIEVLLFASKIVMPFTDARDMEARAVFFRKSLRFSFMALILMFINTLVLLWFCIFVKMIKIKNKSNKRL